MIPPIQKSPISIQVQENGWIHFFHPGEETPYLYQPAVLLPKSITLTWGLIHGLTYETPRGHVFEPKMDTETANHLEEHLSRLQTNLLELRQICKGIQSEFPEVNVGFMKQIRLELEYLLACQAQGVILYRE